MIDADVINKALRLCPDLRFVTAIAAPVMIGTDMETEEQTQVNVKRGDTCRIEMALCDEGETWTSLAISYGGCLFKLSQGGASGMFKEMESGQWMRYIEDTYQENEARLAKELSELGSDGGQFS